MRFLSFLIHLIGPVALASVAYATPITLGWGQSTLATGYHLFKSLDNGATWVQIADVTGSPPPTSVLIQAEDGRLVLYRVSAYNAQGESSPYPAGAWFDSRLTLPSVTVRLGVQ